MTIGGSYYRIISYNDLFYRPKVHKSKKEAIVNNVGIKAGMRVLNSRSKNVGIILGVGEKYSPIFLHNKYVAVLRLVEKGSFRGMYVCTYWRIDNIKNISGKTLF